MIDKNIWDITEEDLQRLVDDKVLEAKKIEYKRALPTKWKEKEKIEFLKDISSFANASGGYLIYGISEDKNGRPKKLEGMEINADKEIQRLESYIRQWIQPRIIGYEIRSLVLSNGKVALLIWVPRSWISPHRVGADFNRFFARNSNGKYELDVGELRIAFNLSETLNERIRKFREDRISKIYADETPVQLDKRTKLILHLIPLISLKPAQVYDLQVIYERPGSIEPIGASGYRRTYNFDGLMAYSTSSEKEGYYDSYVQIYKSGIIEAVETIPFRERENEKQIASTSLEKDLISSLGEYLSIINTLGVELPAFIYLSLVEVRGYSLSVPPRIFPNSSIKIDRDMLLLPEILIESYDVDVEKTLKPWFDSIWNACGYEGSKNYNENGEWVGRR